ERYICIHGHFYQPFRKNPWLERIEIQDDAYPYHDWNEKISAECYGANAAARILNNQNEVMDVVNNYSEISFNFGPTLLEWIKENNLNLFDKIIRADSESQKLFSGHGCAIAQTYNHLIMPLANRQDKYLQILWAIKDFEDNFKRKSEGMWIAETAVDYETLEILADFKIKFTILSPDQSLRFKKIDADISKKEQNWIKVKNGNINTRLPYLCRLPSGREIVIFFYDREISIGVAFGDLLSNGENFANTLINAPSYNQQQPEIVIVATDGETYGHHKKFGDMALAYCLKVIRNSSKARMTVFAEYLEKFPPVYEVEIIENTSWSCRHSICRWKEDCGCSTGDNNHKGWNQKWRKPLREAIDLIRTKIDDIFEREINSYIKPEFKDALSVLADYITIINDRSDKNVENFLNKYLLKINIVNNDDVNFKNKSVTECNDVSKISLLSLLEMQRQAMLMQSSDGWFFDDIFRVEPIQILKSACRTIELAGNFYNEDLENVFLNILKNAESNVSKNINGASIYLNEVKASIYDFKRIAAHLAADLMFCNKTGYDNKSEKSSEIVQYKDYLIELNEYIFKTKISRLEKFENEMLKILSGTAVLISKITLRKNYVHFIALYDKNYSGNKLSLKFYVRKLDCDSLSGLLNYSDKFLNEFNEIIDNKTFDYLTAYIEKLPDFTLYSLKDLTREKQIEIIENIIDGKLNYCSDNIILTHKIVDILQDYLKPWIDFKKYNVLKDNLVKNFSSFISMFNSNSDPDEQNKKF
ncbi:MAG: DUF3536 domain-containing protein, partial [Actinobacteria bacterium]|nr:DUF3536 domain-containing protein [Actinomycetota bacterium]